MPKTSTAKTVALRNNGKMIRKAHKKSVSRAMGPTPTDSEQDTMRAPDSYRLALKALRNRAQLTLEECAKAVELSTTGFQRYENDKKFDSEPIPIRIVRNLISVMTGKGNPPIEEAELWNLSEMRDAPPAAHSRPTGSATFVDPIDFANLPTPHLPVRYHVERGAYRDVGLARSHLGSASIGPSNRWDQGRQWAAVVIGPDGLNYRFTPGTVLHCLDVDAVPMSSVAENAVVVAERIRDKLSEILLARVVEMTGRRTATLRDSEGNEFTGNVLGLIQFQYSPVS